MVVHVYILLPSKKTLPSAASPLPPSDTTTTVEQPTTTKTASSNAQRPQTLSSRSFEDGPYEDIPLVPIISHNHSPISSLHRPKPSYQPNPQSRNRFHLLREPQERPNPVPLRTNIQKPPSSRLWDPINYIPRTPAVREPRRQNPSTNNSTVNFPPQKEGYPLLTISERRRSTQQPSPSSLIVERSIDDFEGGRASIGLPRGHRRSGNWSIDMGDNTISAADESNGVQNSGLSFSQYNVASSDGNSLMPQNTAHDDSTHDIQPQHTYRPQTFGSIPSASANYSSTHVGDAGADDPEDGPGNGEELAWGPAHPCFPHMNPHVPIDSPEYINTRVIRVRRDWMVKGDLAPTFSNLYPEILDPLLSEQEFRAVVSKINAEVTSMFNPFSLRNWIDGIIGFLTGWAWDDFGANQVKGRIRSLEQWLEAWNRDVGATEGVKIWGPRRTGYLSLDIQIPDPKVGIVESEAASGFETRPSSSGTTRHEGQRIPYMRN